MSVNPQQKGMRMKTRKKSVLRHEGIYPSAVYSTASLTGPALENPPDGHVAFMLDQHGSVVRVVWSAAIGTYVCPQYLPYIASITTCAA